MTDKIIKIQVIDKKAILIGTPVIVCGNSDYIVTFDFDNEWSLTGLKTARFVYILDGVKKYTDVAFSGDTVAVPVLADVLFVTVGVFEGNLSTTTPARILCTPSILCGTGPAQGLTEDVYNQLLEAVNELAEKGAFGATEAQARQIEQNKQNIAQLDATKAKQTDVDSLTTRVGQNTQGVTKNTQDIAQLKTTKAAQTDVEALAARMDTFTKLEEGSTTGDAELADIRAGYDGAQYATAGDAVRGQANALVAMIEAEAGQLSSEIANVSDMVTTRTFITEIPTEVGGINGEGVDYEATNRARSIGEYGLHPLFTLSMGAKYKYRLALFLADSKGGNRRFFTYTDWVVGETSLKYVIDNIGTDIALSLVTFRVLIGHNDDSDITNLESIVMKSPQIEKTEPYITTDLLSEVTKGYACGCTPFVASDYYVSPPIKVKPNTTYETYAIRNYALYNAKYQYISNGSGGGGTLVTTPDNEEVAYLIYCWKNTDNNAENMAFAEKGKLTGGYSFNGRVGTDSYKWVAMGDSITAGYYSTGPKAQGADYNKSWAKCVADKKDYVLNNIAIGGSGYLDSEHATDKTNAKMKANATDFSGVDIVTLAYGVNDWKYGFAIGGVNDDKNAGNTMASNMKYVIEKILSDNPLAKIFVITPINCMGYDFNYGDFSTNYGLGYTIPENGKTLEEVFEVQKAICEYYGIQFIDNTHSSVVNRVNIASMLLDGVHPTIECYEVMGRELAEKITY